MRLLIWRTLMRNKRLATLLIGCGLILFLMTYFSSFSLDLNNAQSKLIETVDSIKEQSANYVKYNETAIAKSLVRQAVAVENVCRELQAGKYLEDIVDDYWLTGIVEVDEDGNLLRQYVTDDVDYEMVMDFVSDALKNVVEYSSETYINRYQLDDNSYVDIACHKTSNGVVLAYRHVLEQFASNSRLSIQDVLNGYPEKENGTIVVMQKDKIVASNNLDLLVEGSSDVVEQIRKCNEANTLVRINSHGVYGMYSHGRDFYVYVFVEPSMVYNTTVPNVSIVMVFYCLVIGIILFIRNRQNNMFVLERQRQEEAYKKELEDKNRELELAIKQEAKANRSKQEFLFNMSHDIRTPMNAIIGFTSLAQSHLDDKEMLDSYLKKISTSSEYLLSLINDVLDMSRIESGKLKIEESNVYLPSILEDIRDIVSSNVQKKQLSLNTDIVDLRDSNVLTDPLKLKQVLLNVVANAIKFTPSGGYVNLSLVQKDGYGNYDFIVEDNGIGISKEFQEHIFEQFSREATSTVSRVQGTGLGLSISKAIVDMMGGSISVESESGKGSKFTISLCFKVTDETTDNKIISSNSIIDTNKKVLLVEDNELNYEIAKTVLEEAGFMVDGASNGKEAIDKASDNTYDVILMDIQMPIMDGYEATKELRRLGNKTPIIAMTANAFSEDRKKAKEVGMDGYIPKPIDVNKLVSTIVNILSDQ